MAIHKCIAMMIDMFFIVSCVAAVDVGKSLARSLEFGLSIIVCIVLVMIPLIDVSVLILCAGCQ